MALDDDIRVLSGIGLFKGLAEEHLRLLAFGSDKIRLAGGETLFQEGEAATSAYVVLSGRFDILRDLAGRPDRLTEAGPGALLGELALIAPTDRLISAVAATPAQVMQIDRRNFRRILEEYPAVARRIQRQLIDEFQAMIRRLEQIAPQIDD